MYALGNSLTYLRMDKTKTIFRGVWYKRGRTESEAESYGK